MRFRIGLQFYILIALILTTVPIFLNIDFLIIKREKEIFTNSLREKGIILTQALDANIISQKDLEDRDKLFSIIQKFIWLNPEILRLNIALPTAGGLKVVASNDPAFVDKFIEPAKFPVLKEGIILTKTLITSKGTKVLETVSPIHLEGQRVGICELNFSLESLEKIISEAQKRTLSLTAIGLVTTLLLLFSLLRILVISPIEMVEIGTKIITGGNLDYKLKILREDEIGRLAGSFNEMAKKLSQSYQILEKTLEERTEAKNVLEIRVQARTKELKELAESLEEKVKERTKELHQRIEELERFHRLAVGRELKMIELKKEIERLKKELG